MSGQPDGEALAQRWQAAVGAAAVHQAGCGCTGLLPCVLSERALEYDLLEHLASRCAEGGDGPAAALVRARLEALQRGEADSFGHWLTGLPQRSASAHSTAQLLERIEIFIQSLPTPDRGPRLVWSRQEEIP